MSILSLSEGDKRSTECAYWNFWHVNSLTEHGFAFSSRQLRVRYQAQQWLR